MGCWLGEILAGFGPLVLDEMELAFVDQVESLGVLMDSTFLFEKQTGIVAKSSSYQLYVVCWLCL